MARSGKRRESGRRPKRPPAAPAEQKQPQPDRQPVAPDPWYRRVSFWRAIAGMGLAIALGSAAVALEIASNLSSRTTLFNHQVGLIRSRLSQLRVEATNAQRQLASLRAEQLTRATMNRVLSATDATIFRLTPGAGSSAHGLVAVSRQAGAAIVEIGGLPPKPGQTCVMWWMPAQGAGAKAAEFNPDSDGRVSLAVQMPPRSAPITGVIITREPGKPADQPKGSIILKAVLPEPQVLS
jgi:hypothetical protein